MGFLSSQLFMLFILLIAFIVMLVSLLSTLNTGHYHKAFISVYKTTDPVAYYIFVSFYMFAVMACLYFLFGRLEHVYRRFVFGLSLVDNKLIVCESGQHFLRIRTEQGVFSFDIDAQVLEIKNFDVLSKISFDTIECFLLKKDKPFEKWESSFDTILIKTKSAEEFSLMSYRNVKGNDLIYLDDISRFLSAKNVNLGVKIVNNF